MAATGKKSKKAKWIPASITDIIAEPTTIPTVNSWADSVDEEPESYGFASRTRAPVVLPSASRAARGGMAVDEESIPRRPPFIAHISNLPYDVDESAITELFAGLKITSLRLPREGDRLKGYGYVDFEDRESLINAMNIADLTISGRRIRIDVSTQDNDRRRMGGGRTDRDREYDPERTMGDWRSGPRAAPETQQRARNIERDAPPPRDRDSSADNKPGAWRDGDRPAAAEPARTPYGGRDSFGRDRYQDDRGRGFGGRDSERSERSGYGGRDGFRPADRESGFGGRDSRGFGSRGFGDRDRDRDPPREETKPRERPKLNLLPRTVPRETETPLKPADGAITEDKPKEEKPLAKPVPAEKVFGAAKPVDTAAKEREIEERLRKQEEEARRAAEERERWTRKSDHSGERRGGARRDERRDDRDRGRDSRSYNRDRRDYSKDDKDKRDYSKDDRDRRDYSKDDRDRRDYSKDTERRDYRDDRGRRDYRDERDKRDVTPTRRSSRERDASGDRYDDKDRDREDRTRDRDEQRPREREERSYDRDRPRDRDDRDRDRPRDRDDRSREHAKERDDRPREHAKDERNGRARPSRSRDRPDSPDKERPMPKLKEQEKPNFVASNKFSFLEAEDADEGGSD